MSKVTIVVNSNDNYADAWPPFFNLLEKMWPNVEYPIVLNSETKNYSATNLEVRRVEFPDNATGKPWGWTFFYTLKGIDSEYVLVILEDFFLESPVDTAQFERCLRFLDENKDVACISFQCSPGGKEERLELAGYALIPKHTEYRVNCQIGLWRRKALMKLIRKHENAWAFEHWGTIRGNRRPWRFYSIVYGKPVPFDYNWGKPICRGYWNLEAVAQTERKTGIQISTEGRETIADMASLNRAIKKRWGIKDYWSIIRSLL